MLSVRDLHAYYGKSHILHGVHLDVGKGEIVSILGRNGVGRSTTIKAIMGMVDCRGSVKFQGEEMVGRKAYQIAHQGLGYAQIMSSPGQPRHPHLTQALRLYQELGDLLGQAAAHFGFAMAFEGQRRPQAALDHARQVLSLARAAGHPGEEAAALNLIGISLP